MKRNLLVCFSIFTISLWFHVAPMQKSLKGSWLLQIGSTDVVLIIQDDYLSHSTFDRNSKKFYETYGGPYQLKNNILELRIEFNSAAKEKVGQTNNYTFRFENENLFLIHDGTEAKWKRIDDNTNALAGTWRISGRMQGEKMNPIQPSPRKTLKILSGTRFQWMAINTETKEFFGTGGGTYTFKDGRYTENIEFFSRDSSRVGASLTFEGKVENNLWTHKGKNSRGEPLHEEWKRESQLLSTGD